MEKIKITLVEDTYLDLHVLVKTLESTGKVEVVDTYMDGVDVINAYTKFPTEFDVLVMDYRLPMLNGLETFRNLRMKFPKLKMLLVSHGYYPSVMHDLIGMGSQNYCRKVAEVMIPAIMRIMQGRNIYDNSNEIIKWEGLSKCDALQLKDDSYWRKLLSPLDKKIIICVCNGCNSSKIADLLGYETSSIEKYRGFILKLLGLKNSQQLVTWAFANGMVNSTKMFHSEINFEEIFEEYSDEVGISKGFLKKDIDLPSDLRKKKK